MPKFNFGGAPKCGTCQKSVYKEEELVFEGTHYHNNGCFKCSICNESIANVSKAGSMHGKVSHRLCFEKQMRTSGGKYGGEKVVAGALTSNKAGAAAAPVATKPAAAPVTANPAAAPVAANPAAAAVAEPAAENTEEDAANAAFYARKKAQKQARITAEKLWDDIVKAANGSYDGDKLQQMWDEYDADRSGNIDAGELTKLISAIVTDVGVSSDVPKLVEATITCMDADGDGALTWNEFIHLSVIQNMGDRKQMSKLASQAQFYQEAEDENAAFYARKKAQKHGYEY